MTLDIEAPTFAARFPHRAFEVRHDLVGHPLLDIETLAELAATYPPELIEQSRATVPVLVPHGEVEDLGAGPADLVRGLRRYGCRVSLRHVDRVPAYADLIDTVLADASPHVGPVEGPIARPSGFVFMSADEAITPAHCDPEYNFLLQLRGTKRVSVGELDAATRQREMERQHGGGNRNIGVMPDAFETFELHPGTGLFIPPEAPHWVENGGDESVSFSVTFYTERIARAELVHTCNRALRASGLAPTAPGQSPARDKAKAFGVRAWRAARRRLRVKR
jgi:hypothetical protein